MPGFFWGLIALLIVAGSICGIVALVKVRRLLRDLEDLRTQLKSFQYSSKEPGAAASADEKEISPEEPIVPVPAGTIDSTDLVLPEPPLTAPEIPPKSPRLSLELRVGTRWLNWVGIIMLLIGIGFFLKYAYDNAWIGPTGRLAIGTILGLAGLGLGERFRKRDWPVFSQVLTGGALAVFYLCIYFSFLVYRLSDQTISMMLAVLITALAVVMAVAHHAVSIAVLALIGGFLSPVLLSTGENRPYAFFTYIAILDMVALGTAYFRRWRILDLLCFAGTVIMYVGWNDKFYRPDQMTPALIYTSLFYLMFLIVPTLHGLVRRLAETPEGLVIVLFSAALSLFSYYDILFPHYRTSLGFVVIGQALLVFLLFELWIARVGTDNRIAGSLLAITLGLVIIAIPIQLRFYGIPIAWGMEAGILTYLGIRFRQTLCKVGGSIALILATAGLLERLPLHKVFFIPVFNVPFGSWLYVVAMTAISAYLLHRGEVIEQRWQKILATATFLLSLALAFSLLSMEVLQFWTVNHPVAHFRTYGAGSLVVLWSLIPMGIAYVIVRKESKKWMPLSWVCFGIGSIMLLTAVQYHRYPSPWLFLNAEFLPRFVFVISLWYGASLCRRFNLKIAADVQALAGHGILALLVALEFRRWGAYGDFVTPKMSLSLISAAWAIHAFLVIWIGLVRRNPLLRYLGFVLFLFSVGKTLIFDMSEVEKVYRIISFVASGLLLVAAGYFYQRYSWKILERTDSEIRK